MLKRTVKISCNASPKSVHRFRLRRRLELFRPATYPAFWIEWLIYVRHSYFPWGIPIFLDHGQKYWNPVSSIPQDSVHLQPLCHHLPDWLLEAEPTTNVTDLVSATENVRFQSTRLLHMKYETRYETSFVRKPFLSDALHLNGFQNIDVVFLPPLLMYGRIEI